jgi:hypothetical protein
MTMRGAAIAAVCVLLAACGGGGEQAASNEPAMTPDGQVIPPSGEGPAHDFMNELMQKQAEVIWNSAGYIVTSEGERSLAPTTDEGWAEVAAGAEAVKVTGEFLKTVPWRRDDTNWVAFSEGVINAGERARLGAVAKSEPEMFESGAQLYNVCVACHQFYRVGEFEVPAEE